jgi:DNA-binding GntR family transcriptional regulator
MLTHRPTLVIHWVSPIVWGYAVPETPAYLLIAGDLRTAILTGALAPGAKLPSETQLMAQYGVSRTVAKWAVSVLKGEGIVEGRRGSGTFVRSVQRLVRHAHGRDQRTSAGPTSPFARDAERGGQRGTWRHRSERVVADADIARRLAIRSGDPVMSTRYVFLTDSEPIQLSHSREPLAVTGGTPVEWPEDGAAVGVVARMDLIGVRIDESVERITARPAIAGEAEELRLPARAPLVFVIERTYYAGGVPVETADITIPGDRYELVYRIPID